VVVIVGLFLVSSGLGVTPVAAAPPVKESDLQGVTQNWDKNLPSASRFTVLPSFNNQAARDNETGLVWEKSPDTTTRIWTVALSYCIDKNVGGRKGWRLPSIPELASLIDPNAGSAPFLPAGHPFINVQSAPPYWSATTQTGTATPTIAWSVHFIGGNVGPNLKEELFFAWCVRGPMNTDVY
jgi:hypothetical protein